METVELPELAVGKIYRTQCGARVKVINVHPRSREFTAEILDQVTGQEFVYNYDGLYVNKEDEPDWPFHIVTAEPECGDCLFENKMLPSKCVKTNDRSRCSGRWYKKENT